MNDKPINKGIPGYNLKEKIAETSRSVVFRAQKDNSDLNFIIKIFKAINPTPYEL